MTIVSKNLMILHSIIFNKRQICLVRGEISTFYGITCKLFNYSAPTVGSQNKNPTKGVERTLKHNLGCNHVVYPVISHAKLISKANLCTQVFIFLDIFNFFMLLYIFICDEKDSNIISALQVKKLVKS